jgi:Kef-type K+ transport system membrane component KefB
LSGSTSAYIAAVLLDLAVIIAAGSLLAAVALRFGQPAVIGEIVAGILLGPTLLGALPGHLTTRLFPISDRAFLSVLANLGLVLFMFGVGFELDHEHLRRIRSAAAAVSLSSVTLPFLLGTGLAILVYPANHVVDGHHVGRLAFVLFLGVATSITAFPVLARILTGLEMQRTRLGTFVMTCAAGADLMAWAVLALVVAIASPKHSSGGPYLAIGEMAVFILALAFVIRPALRVVLTSGLAARSHGKLPLLAIVVGLLLTAWVTTRLGFQPIFGGFAFGAITPRSAVRQAAPEIPLLIEQASQLLVPVFFVTTGLSVNLSSLGASGYLEAAAIIAVATTGKFVGAAGASALCGFDKRRAAAVGVLMNTRGLTELVVLQVGLSMGILSERLTSMMIIMAIVTTVVATPVFRRIYTEGLQREDDRKSSTAYCHNGIGAPADNLSPVPGGRVV